MRNLACQPTPARTFCARRLGRAISVVAVAVAGVSLAADQSEHVPALATVLQRAGERVERYFARAQSIVCLEVVHLQPLTSSWSSEGFGRTVESELRLSWEPAADGTLPTEAQALRQLLKVNGHPPRLNDRDNCTVPEQQSQEPHLLSLLLPSQRADYQFALVGPRRLDRRTAIVVDYRLVKEVSVDSKMVEGKEDCVSFNLEGGMRGRIWIDAETYDVLRLDQGLTGLIEIPLPKAAKRRLSAPTSWTMERWDTSIRFTRISFTNPDETLVLPTSLTSTRITRGSGIPRLRTTTDYRNYQRFLTGGRVVGE